MKLWMLGRSPAESADHRSSNDAELEVARTVLVASGGVMFFLAASLLLLVVAVSPLRTALDDVVPWLPLIMTLGLIAWGATVVIDWFVVSERSEEVRRKSQDHRCRLQPDLWPMGSYRCAAALVKFGPTKAASLAQLEPRSIWSRAAFDLLRHGPDARLLAITSERLPRSIVLNLAQRDPDVNVRQGACAWLLEHAMTTREIVKLARSKYGDVVVRAVDTRRLSRRRLLGLLCVHAERVVRDRIWSDFERLAPSVREVGQLLRSVHVDVVERAVRRAATTQLMALSGASGKKNPPKTQMLAQSALEARVRHAQLLFDIEAETLEGFATSIVDRLRWIVRSCVARCQWGTPVVLNEAVFQRYSRLQWLVRRGNESTQRDASEQLRREGWWGDGLADTREEVTV